MKIQPEDEANRELVSLVAPTHWPAPVPAPRYNLVVLGGGTAGLITALGAAGLGARVALVEGGMMGGDCLNWGCVPSKALLASAHAAQQAREVSKLGVRTGEVEVDFPAVMRRMRELRTHIAHHDSFARVKREGVDVFQGFGRFVSPRAVEVGGHRLRFAKAVIATGAKAVVPPIPGLERCGYLTHETLFQLTERPQRLLIVGAGPVGCEMAQAFCRFGSQVTVVDAAPAPLPREDEDASEVVRKQLEEEGVRWFLGTTLDRVRGEGGAGEAWIQGVVEPVPFDAVLVATGRRPNVAKLGLSEARIRTGDRGQLILGTDLRTSNPRVFAAGDVAGHWQLTHAADAMARLVIRNALFPGRSGTQGLVMPHATYTDPGVAHVGPSVEEAKAQGASPYTVQLADVDRAKLSGTMRGFVRVWAQADGTLVAATAVAPHAGDLISGMSIAMTHGLTMGQLSSAIHPYPTLGEAWKKAGDAYMRTQLTPFRARLLRRFLAWIR